MSIMYKLQNINVKIIVTLLRIRFKYTSKFTYFQINNYV